jgi:hypothetical protein
MSLNRLLDQGSKITGGKAIPQKQQAQHGIHLHQLRLYRVWLPLPMQL